MDKPPEKYLQLQTNQQPQGHFYLLAAYWSAWTEKHFPALLLSCTLSAVRTGADNCHCCHLLLKVTLLVQMQSVTLCPLFSCWVTSWLSYVKMCSNDKCNTITSVSSAGSSGWTQPAGSTPSLGETILLSRFDAQRMWECSCTQALSTHFSPGRLIDASNRKIFPSSQQCST